MRHRILSALLGSFSNGNRGRRKKVQHLVLAQILELALGSGTGTFLLE